MGDSEKSVQASPSHGVGDPEVEVFSYLTRSNLRVDVLLTIQAQGSIDERELRQRYDAARTTITRTLNGFTSRGWITREGGACTVTASGDAVATTVREAIESLEPVADLDPFLRRVPAEAFDLDPTHLETASVTVAEPGSPYAPIETVTELRQRSSTVRELSSIVAQESAEQVHERAVAGDATFEIVLQSTVIEQIHSSPSYRRQFEETVAQETVDVRVYEGTFPFLVVLLDDVVALGVTNDDDLPAALVVSNDGTVRTWAESVYQEYYEAARPYDEGTDE